MLIIFLVLFLIFVFICILPLYLEINYLREKNNDLFKINIFVLTRFLGLQIKVPFVNNYLSHLFTEMVIELDNKFIKLFSKKNELEIKEVISWEKINLEEIKKVLLKSRVLVSIIKRLNIKCHHFKWETEYGFYDPALTGVSSGILWTVKGSAITYIYNNMKVLNTPEVKISPDFDHLKLNIMLKSIFSARVGNIIFEVFYQFIGDKLRSGPEKPIKIKGDSASGRTSD